MKLLCDGHTSDGRMSVLILTDKRETLRYEYKVDTAHIPGWKKRMPYQPGKVLNEIKRNAISVSRLLSPTNM